MGTITCTLFVLINATSALNTCTSTVLDRIYVKINNYEVLAPRGCPKALTRAKLEKVPDLRVRARNQRGSTRIICDVFSHSIII